MFYGDYGIEFQETRLQTEGFAMKEVGVAVSA